MFSDSFCMVTFMQANKKTRNRAYEVLVQIGREYGDEDDSGQREDLFNMVSDLFDISPTPIDRVVTLLFWQKVIHALHVLLVCFFFQRN